MKNKILFTADLHGNEVQYQKLIKYAKKISADIVIIGGDIAPKGNVDDYIENQKNFLEHRLPKILRPLKCKLPYSNLFLMMGNDDCAVNMGVLDNNDKLFKVIHNERTKLTEDFDIVGYSFVPITPFGIKDWEKYDLSKVPVGLCKKYAQRKLTTYRLDGFKSTKSRLERFRFDSEIEGKDSIQKDLKEETFCKNPKKTVYVIHTPPDNTNLDMLLNKNHAGSMAVRLFIEKKQPYLTLHGHIHETVLTSGKFKERIGKTVCLTAGNDDYSNQLAVLEFNLYNLENVVRRLI
jgi:Icc-related predicted phosphoesterase